MSEDLLQTLENKVQNAVELVELLKAEIEELTEENATLREVRSQWEEKLINLIGKFEQLEETVGTNVTEAETVVDVSPEGNNSSGEDDSSEPDFSA
jgi:cell division protein ZapB